jgi:hypothetical protein
VGRQIEAWSTVHSRSEDGTLMSIQRARSARPVVELSDAGAKDLGQRYWREAVRASRGLVYCRQGPVGVELRLLGRGPVLLSFRPAETSVEGNRVSCTYSIRGGLLTRREGGMLALSQIGRAEVELRAEVTEFAPRLGVTLGFVQRRFHAAISRRYFSRLVAETHS